ncbi:MAG TPA: hypothetical protein VME17_26065 [Bryobacteraceae bacterium]|nr:hypothetical protein [Bryobacteraceae bacterium]
MTGSGADLVAELNPNDLTSQAQNPTDLGKLRIGVASEEAAGVPASCNTMLYDIGEMGPIRSSEAFFKINQVTGFDCQSCAWPSPDQNLNVFEFCENGAKAVSDEFTKKRIGPGFFAKYSIADLAAKSDCWLKQQGRLTTPMVRHAFRFATVPYALARRSAAAYYPETNVLTRSVVSPPRAISRPLNQFALRCVQ